MKIYCKAKGCNNKSIGKVKDSEITFFPIPDPKRHPALCKQWLHNLGTGIDFKTYKYRGYHNTICEEHFEEHCFVENIRAKVLNLPQKRKLLRSDAVPTIFSHRKIPKRRLGTERRIEAKRKREMLDRILKEYKERKEERKEQVREEAQQVVVKKEPATVCERIYESETCILPATQCQFSLAEECNRIAAISQRQTQAPDEATVFLNTWPDTQGTEKVMCTCLCRCGARGRTGAMNGERRDVLTAGTPLTLETVLQREPDQIISIRVSATGAVTMVDAVTQVEKTFANKKVQAEMDPEPDNELYGNWERVCKEHNYFVSEAEEEDSELEL